MFKKKLFGLVLALSLIWGGGAAWAAPAVYLNGQKLGLDAILQEGRVLVGVREIAEALDFQVDWKAASKTVAINKGNNSILLVIGSPTAWINGQSRDLEVPAQIEQGRTMVPVRLVAEALGLEVNWDGTRQAVELTASPDYLGIWHLTAWQMDGENYPLLNITLVLQEQGQAYLNLPSGQEKGTWTVTTEGISLTDSLGITKDLLAQEGNLVLDYPMENYMATLTFAK